MQFKTYYQGKTLKAISYKEEKFYYNFNAESGWIKPHNGIKLYFESFHFGLGRTKTGKVETIWLNDNMIMLDRSNNNFNKIVEFLHTIKGLQRKPDKDNLNDNIEVVQV